MDLQEFREIANEVEIMVDDINSLRNLRRNNCFCIGSTLPSTLKKTQDELLDKIEERMCNVKLLVSIFERSMELVPKKLQLDNEVAKKMLSYGNIGVMPADKDRDTIITTEELNENERYIFKATQEEERRKKVRK